VANRLSLITVEKVPASGGVLTPKKSTIILDLCMFQGSLNINTNLAKIGFIKHSFNSGTSMSGQQYSQYQSKTYVMLIVFIKVNVRVMFILMLECPKPDMVW